MWMLAFSPGSKYGLSKNAFGAHRESEGRNPPLSNSVNVCLVPKALLFPRIAVTFYGGRNLTAS
jgi:hypothetical protein